MFHSNGRHAIIAAMKQRQVMLMITPPLPQMLDGIVRYAREHGWRLILANRFLRTPNDWDGDGALVTLREGDESPRFVEGLARRGIPFVDLTFRRPDISAPRVMLDYESVGSIATGHFAEIGLRHAAWFSTVWSNVHSLIFKGFSKTWTEQVGGKPQRIVLADSVPKSRLDNTERFIAAIGPKLQALPKPVGIFALNDDEAARILELCIELGLHVPEEVAVLGIGNDTFLCENQTVPISSIIDSPEARGYEGSALLDRMIDGESPPRTPTIIPCRDIVVRRSTDTVAAENPILRQALSIIRDDFVNPPSAVQLAERLGISRATLDRLFSGELGRSFRSEILRRRLLKASSLLRESELPVKVIAAECGFCNSGHFVNVFRNTYGKPPEAWRRAAGRNAR